VAYYYHLTSLSFVFYNNLVFLCSNFCLGGLLRKLLLLFTLLTLPAYGATFSFNASLYRFRDDLNYRRQVGWERWRGERSGFMLFSEFSQLFKVKKGAWLKLSVTTGTPKTPFVNLFTSPDDSIFGGSRQFTVKELYFHKDHFLFDGLVGSFGKQRFSVPAVYDDYLWGGRFLYRYSPKLSFYWNQVAGYEGRFLLFKTKKEDDVDLFTLGLNYDFGPFGLNGGVYRISDALGPLPGVSYEGLFLRVFGSSFNFEAATQNGKKAFWFRGNDGNLSLSFGHSPKGFTSYGYAESVRDLGTIFKPSFTDLSFFKVSYSFPYFSPYFLYLRRAGGSFLGSELGAEFDYPVYKNLALFLKAAKGSKGSYGYFLGVKNCLCLPVSNLKGVKFENRFDLAGEYADLPRRFYYPQLGYEGWERALHVGYWHSTYRLAVEKSPFRLQVATGPDSKVDYLVWGNSADNFLHQRSHGKEWHLEELYLFKGNWKLGAARVALPNLFNDYAAGLFYEGDAFGASLFRYGPYGSSGGAENAFGALLSYSFGRLSLYGASLKSGSAKVSAAALLFKEGGSEFSLLKESSGGWGAAFGKRGEFFNLSYRLSYLLYSPKFTTFGLREWNRNLGYTFRPTEKDLRLLSLKLTKNLTVRYSKLRRLSPAFSVFYRNLNSYSNDFVAQEWGVELKLKPGRYCYFKLIGALGTNNSYYEGVKFSVNW
jgi:hypothetical protein